MSTLSLTRWPTVTEPTYGYVTYEWLVKMSDGSTERFKSRWWAESFILCNPPPSLKTLLSASVKEQGNG